jgi:hypothetical protein
MEICVPVQAYTLPFDSMLAKSQFKIPTQTPKPGPIRLARRKATPCTAA